MKCTNPTCSREACTAEPVAREIEDFIDGQRVTNTVIFDEAREAAGFCCVFCRFALEDNRPPTEHNARCQRRFKGLEV